MRKSTSLMLVFMAMLMMSSCVSTKKIVYFQDPQEVFRQGQQLMQQYEMRLKPADQVLIKVTCSEPELLTIFAQDVMMGTAGTNSSQNITNNNGSMTNAYGYTVSNEGIITLPAVGQVSVAGLTTDEAARRIEQSIINAKLIKDPEVTVRLLNARVAVLGAVKSPQVVNLTSERNTILDILSRCGDIADTGLRQNVTLYREEDGVLKKYPIDLTSVEVFQNPAYYVQQNDMIYVEPNNKVKRTTTEYGSSMVNYTFWVGIVTSALTLIAIFK